VATVIGPDGLHRTPAAVTRPAASMGKHTAAILAGGGYSETDIGELVATGAAAA
jgi:crotonobetainyl-CoA:carnitine CoA-transferase CaiB-like acyl-CoA transferase